MNFEYEFHHVLKDNTSGSSSILNQSIDILINYFSQNHLCHTNEIQDIAYKLSENFPSFAVIQHFTKEFKYYIKQDKKIKSDEILKFLDEYKNKWRDVNIRIAQNLLSKVHVSNKTILLHSNSYSIHSVFSEIKNNNYQVKVIQTISYPAKEGIKQAEILSDFGFHITLISDSIIAKYIPNTDLALLGADVIFDNCFINKTGSFPISASCKYYNKPVYVIADSRKKADKNSYNQEIINKLKIEKMKDTSEIYKSNLKNIKSENYYFEKVPNNLITEFIFEK